MILYEIEQKFKSSKIHNLRETIREELSKNTELKGLPAGSRVAITAGSRGIDNIVVILREVVSYLKDKQLFPFIVPAMGSHGGATAEGQLAVLYQLGITEDTIDAPIKSSMDVVNLGEVTGELPVYMDKFAYEADAIIVINRVKAHTAFSGKIESGLSKMVMVGLGKQKGASFVHSQGAERMEYNIVEGSKFALENSPICMGLAIVEDSYEQTAIIKGVSKENWHEEEGELLKQSKDLMPSLPVSEIDLLIVEEMGKVYSGTGMDPNIIGRIRIDGVQEPTNPKIRRITVLDLAEKSHGNAQGIGLADFTTEKLVEKVDKQVTYMNTITTTFLRRAMLPLIYSTEQEAIEQAFLSLGPNFKREEGIIIQIANTLHINRLIVSESALEKIPPNVEYSIINKFNLSFQNGDLVYKLSKKYVGESEV
ncbi:nickel pincer cofactor-dependent isomerase, group 22 [Ornithinibacillus californiensis]|uniref:lactate racemase domain-containing protein n=1 Tax=Ornithinibacillus californiensis TaxID=161536 RepID=UPI00064D73C8|nr:lactate racemase domain-containing protein [Ornithinibacillus californiensis]